MDGNNGGPPLPRSRLGGLFEESSNNISGSILLAKRTVLARSRAADPPISTSQIEDNYSPPQPPSRLRGLFEDSGNAPSGSILLAEHKVSARNRTAHPPITTPQIEDNDSNPPPPSSRLGGLFADAGNAPSGSILLAKHKVSARSRVAGPPILHPTPRAHVRETADIVLSGNGVNGRVLEADSDLFQAAPPAPARKPSTRRLVPRSNGRTKSSEMKDCDECTRLRSWAQEIEAQLERWHDIAEDRLLRIESLEAEVAALKSEMSRNRNEPPIASSLSSNPEKRNSIEDIAWDDDETTCATNSTPLGSQGRGDEAIATSARRRASTESIAWDEDDSYDAAQLEAEGNSASANTAARQSRVDSIMWDDSDDDGAELLPPPAAVTDNEGHAQAAVGAIQEENSPVLAGDSSCDAEWTMRMQSWVIAHPDLRSQLLTLREVLPKEVLVHSSAAVSLAPIGALSAKDEANALRRAYKRVLLAVHPDKLRRVPGLSTQARMRATGVFTVLSESAAREQW